MLLSQLAIASSSHAILTATTTNVIIGNAPEVIALSSEDKQGFTVNGVFYSEANGNIKTGEIKEFDGNLTFNDFVISRYDSKNLDKVKNYRDIDGDNADPSVPFKLETTYYWWYDNTGKRIEGDDKKKIMGCGSGYAMPLKLIIKTNVKAYSAYGIPKESEPITLTKTYQIAPRTQICYAKPYSLEKKPEHQWVGVDDIGRYFWNDSNYAQRNSAGGGYTQDYVPNYGFKAKPTVSSSTFPTTGFPGAKFQLVMTGAQSDYKYSIVNDNGGQVAIDTTKGYVILNKKPAGPITVRATLLRDTQVKIDYTFDPRSIWAIPQRNFFGPFEEAKIRCGGEQNMLTRLQMSNSPRSELVGNEASFENAGDDFLSNAYTRSIGQSLFAEWGWSDQVTYPDSGWLFGVDYWTKDKFNGSPTSSSHYVIHSHDGWVGWRLPAGGVSVACKE
ncbi:hypothetical protein A9G29_07900 [Gilliamella sp. Fer2-1]|nr:hypothetical protein A9G29_07900 [Gilliamella apicola]